MEKSLYGYHTLDARRISEKIRSNKIDVTITSPPYWHLKNYDMELQIGYGQAYDDYLNDLVDIFTGIYNATKDNGSLWIVIDTFKQNKEVKLLPFDLASHLKEIGWKLQDIIIWVKDKNLPWSHKGKLRNIFEYILFFSKSSDFKFFLDRVKDPKNIQNWWINYPERYNPKGKAPERIWDLPIPTQGSWSNGWIRHFCPFPPELVERILLLTTNKNNTVLDPFAGSGVVLAQAKVMGRKTIGFDINPSYKEMYETKVLPFIQSEWLMRHQELIRRQKDSARFSTKIRVLRQLKYPKMLLKYAKNKGIFNYHSISHVIVISSEKNMAPKIFILFKDTFDSSKVISEIESLMLKPPLSKYGLSPDVIAVQIDDFNKKSEDLAQQIFYIYECGNTHFYKQKIKAQELFGKYNNIFPAARNKFPSIISNMAIRISRNDKVKK